jgi:hypothetical protein
MLMCRGWECTRILQIRQLDGLPSTCRWAEEVYVPSDPHQAAPVVFGYTLRARENWCGEGIVGVLTLTVIVTKALGICIGG